MALINGAEGDEDAVEWLEKAGLITLSKVALAADNDLGAFRWLQQHDLLFSKIALEMRKVKNEIEDNNVDPHKMGSI